MKPSFLPQRTVLGEGGRHINTYRKVLRELGRSTGWASVLACVELSAPKAWPGKDSEEGMTLETRLEMCVCIARNVGKEAEEALNKGREVGTHTVLLQCCWGGYVGVQVCTMGAGRKGQSSLIVRLSEAP